MNSNYKVEIFDGDSASVKNQLNNLLKNVDTIISVTQSQYGTVSVYMTLTIIYTPKILGEV